MLPEGVAEEILLNGIPAFKRSLILEAHPHGNKTYFVEYVESHIVSADGMLDSRGEKQSDAEGQRVRVLEV